MHLQVRGFASGAAATANWVTNAAVAQTFPVLTRTLGGSGTFWLYAGVAAAGAVWAFFSLVETQGAFQSFHPYTVGVGIGAAGDSVLFTFNKSEVHFAFFGPTL